MILRKRGNLISIVMGHVSLSWVYVRMYVCMHACREVVMLKWLFGHQTTVPLRDRTTRDMTSLEWHKHLPTGWLTWFLLDYYFVFNETSLKLGMFLKYLNRNIQKWIELSKTSEFEQHSKLLLKWNNHRSSSRLHLNGTPGSMTTRAHLSPGPLLATQ